MNPRMILLAIDFLNSPAGQKIAGKLTDAAAGSLGRGILQGIGGKDYDPTDEDVRDFADLAGAFSDRQSSERQSTMQSTMQPLSNYETSARDLFVDKPEKMLAKIGINAISNGAKAAGGIAENNANRLATAILEGYRQHSDAQDQRFGASARDKANAMWAQNKARSGTNSKLIANAISDTLDRGLNMYEQQDLAAKQLTMTEATRKVPSALYDLFGRQQTAQSRGQK